ncbi:MAG: GTP-binding protein [Candidatus Heimdallarchaeota archaeon]|nr:GTP-binding protein [Candidatus Heimdallarchaeota archaeon]MDH5644916.1 GTP-binding protein [Candidatus Heimdallarchaeota archaeon]
MSVKSKVYKIVLLGEGGVGKTALRHRYLGAGFKQSYSMTIGADFAAKRTNVDDKDVTLQIWDLAGQGRFQSVREVYYKGSLGALLVFDITRQDTYNVIPNWITELMENNGNKMVPLVLIGNKGDLRGQTEEQVPVEACNQYASMLSDWSGYNVPYVETSALSGENVENAFAELIRNVGAYLDKLRSQ